MRLEVLRWDVAGHEARRKSQDMGRSTMTSNGHLPMPLWEAISCMEPDCPWVPI